VSAAPERREEGAGVTLKYYIIVAAPLMAAFFLAQHSWLWALGGLCILFGVYSLFADVILDESDDQWLLVGGGVLSYALGWIGSHFF